MNSAAYAKMLKELLDTGFSREVAERLAREGSGIKAPRVPRPRRPGQAPTESTGEFAGQFELPFDNIDSPMRSTTVEQDLFPDWNPKVRSELEEAATPMPKDDGAVQSSLPFAGNAMQRPSMLSALTGKAKGLGSAVGGAAKRHPYMAGLGGIAGIGALLSQLGGDDEQDGYTESPALSAVFDNNDPVERLRAATDIGPAVPGDRHLSTRGKTPTVAPKPKIGGSPMTAALRKPAANPLPPANGITSFAQGGVKAPDFGVDSSGLDSLFKSIEADTSKDPYSMGLPQQKQGGGFGDALKQFGPLLAAMLFGRLMR